MAADIWLVLPFAIQIRKIHVRVEAFLHDWRHEVIEGCFAKRVGDVLDVSQQQSAVLKSFGDVLFFAIQIGFANHFEADLPDVRVVFGMLGIAFDDIYALPNVVLAILKVQHIDAADLTLEQITDVRTPLHEMMFFEAEFFQCRINW
jgi:hypothetical protein